VAATPCAVTPDGGLPWKGAAGMSRDSRKMHVQLAGKRKQLRKLLADIRYLLDEIADAEADVSWSLPAVPVVDVPNRLAELARHVRHLFGLEEDERYLTELSQRQPHLREGLERLHAEHGELLRLLEELCELSGTSIQPASSWDDIELHYLCFERRLTVHHQDEDALLEKAGLAEV
jgi:hypothetical protein